MISLLALGGMNQFFTLEGWYEKTNSSSVKSQTSWGHFSVEGVSPQRKTESTHNDGGYEVC